MMAYEWMHIVTFLTVSFDKTRRLTIFGYEIIPQSTTGSDEVAPAKERTKATQSLVSNRHRGMSTMVDTYLEVLQRAGCYP